MKGIQLHCIWFCHQPAFIPDAEIAWRVDSTYEPLLDALLDRGIPSTFGMTGSLLRRCASIRPEFVADLRRSAQQGRISLLGTAAYHPVLPWLSSRSAHAQVLVDKQIKDDLGLPTMDLFWPTELAWSARIGALARHHGYSSVVVDSASRDAADMLPQWTDDGHGLKPDVSIHPNLGLASRIQSPVGTGAGRSALTLWVRERSLSKALLEAVHADDDDAAQFMVFARALRASTAMARAPSAPLLLAEDAERLLPNGLERLLTIFDMSLKSGLRFIDAAAFERTPCQQTIGYVPAGTMEEADAMWLATIDDEWYLRHSSNVAQRVESRFDLLHPRTDEERDIRDTLLRAQDSSFYFWHYLSRTRQNFYADLWKIENWLDAGG